MTQPLYNIRHLARPPSSSLKPAVHADSEVFAEAKSKLQDCINVLSSSSDLVTEHHVLKKLLRRKRNQIRCQKVFRSLSQVAKFVERFTEVSLGKCALELLSAFEGDLCPSRQMVEYFLVRMMGVAVLLAETNNFCLKTYLELYQHLKTGHLVPQNLIFLGALSRIRLMVCALYLNVVDWYDSLVGRLHLFTPAAFTWLPEDHGFPAQLSGWVAGITSVPSPVSQQTQELQQQQLLQPRQQTPQLLPREWKKGKSLVTRMLEKFAKKPSKKASSQHQTQDSSVREETSRLSILGSTSGEAECENAEESFSWQSHINPNPDLEEKWEFVQRDDSENVSQRSVEVRNPRVDSSWLSASGPDSTVDALDLEKVEVSAKKRKKLKQKLLKKKKEKFAMQKKKLKKARGSGMGRENDSSFSEEGVKRKKKLPTVENLLLSHDSSGVADSLIQKKQKKEKQKKKKDVHKSFESEADGPQSGWQATVGETAGRKVTKRQRKKMKKHTGSCADSSSSSQLLHIHGTTADIRMTEKMNKLMKMKGMCSVLDSLPPALLDSPRHAKKLKKKKMLMKLGSSNNFNSANGKRPFLQSDQSTNHTSGQKKKKKRKRGNSSFSATDDSVNHSVQKKKKKQKQSWIGSADQSSMSMKTEGRKKKRKGKKRRAVGDGPIPNKKRKT